MSCGCVAGVVPWHPTRGWLEEVFVFVGWELVLDEEETSKAVEKRKSTSVLLHAVVL